jgi:hypothetical protein
VVPLAEQRWWAGTSTVVLSYKVDQDLGPERKARVAGWAVSRVATGNQSDLRCLKYGPDFYLDRCRPPFRSEE